VVKKAKDNPVVKALAAGGYLEKVGAGRFVRIDTYHVKTKGGQYRCTVHVETEATNQPIK
jgi:hypothetical protein